MSNHLDIMQPLPTPSSDDNAPKLLQTTMKPPPPYAQGTPCVEHADLYPSTDVPPASMLSLKRCLIWRIAVDWRLCSHVPQAERPCRIERKIFAQSCVRYCMTLGVGFDSQAETKRVKQLLTKEWWSCV